MGIFDSMKSMWLCAIWSKIGVLTAAGVTAFVSPLLVGFLTDRTGSYLSGFALFSVVSLGLLLAGLKLPETGPGWRGGRR